MAKYSLELKKKVVEAYHRGEGSYCYLAQKYGITNKRQVLNWVHSYDAFGCEGLMRSRKKQTYSFNIKFLKIRSPPGALRMPSALPVPAVPYLSIRSC